MAALFSIAFANLRQGQVEKTMNINMASQMILTKLAGFVHERSDAVDTNILDHEGFLNNVFNMVLCFSDL